MGFRFERINFTGGAGEWGTGSTARSRAESVVREVARAIIRTGTGWRLDTDKNATETDFREVPYIDSDGETMPGLCLENAVSGNKLFFAYIATRCDHGMYLLLPGRQLMPCGEVTNPSYTGLLMSMIPGAAGQVFGQEGTHLFLPSAATRVYGTCQGSGKQNTTAYARHNREGLLYSWGILATHSCIAIACGYSETETPCEMKMCFACGRLFDYLAQYETTPQARYGVVQFTASTGGNNAEGGTWKRARVNYGDATVEVWGTEMLTTEPSPSVSTLPAKSSGCVFKADGTAIGHTATANVRVFAENYGQLSEYAKSAGAGVRWIPYTVAVVSTDLQNDGIVPGDGLKGYLDTDLFRCARAERGQYYNGKRFVGAGYGLMLGWHPDNVDEL